jgi:hypothetical protein
MTTNNKTRPPRRVTSNSQFQNTPKTSKNQAVPLPGTALCAFLRRYRQDLLDTDRTGELSLLLDCVDGLIMAAERGAK